MTIKIKVSIEYQKFPVYNCFAWIWILDITSCFIKNNMNLRMYSYEKIKLNTTSLVQAVKN